MSLSIEELHTKIEARAEKIKGGEEKLTRQAEHITNITMSKNKSIEHRARLISEVDKVDDRIRRQDLHTEKLINSSKRMMDHISRWRDQQDRDMESIRVLEAVNETPSE